MKLKLLLPILALAACSNPSNILIGNAVPAGPTWPLIAFNGLNSVIGGQVALSDPAGNPTGEQAWVIVMSDTTSLCHQMATDPNYFRHSKAPYNAILFFIPAGRLGTFIVGRPGDEGTFAELIGSVGTPAGATPKPTAPFQSLSGSIIAVTNFENGNANGNFDVGMIDPLNSSPAPFEFTGSYQAIGCPAFATILLP
jgi:hypothetical protein